MITKVKITVKFVKKLVELLPDHTALDIAELFNTKDEAINFLRIYQEHIKPIE